MKEKEEEAGPHGKRAKSAEEALAGEMEAALAKALGEGCDIFGFGNTLSQRYPRWWAEYGDGWQERMARCGYEIEVELH